MKIFGSTQYVKVDVSESKLIGNFADVAPYEEYLQLKVKNQWDFNPDKYHLVYSKDFTYYIILCSKKENDYYHSHRYLKTEDLTEEHTTLIENYFKNATKQ